MKNTSGIVLLLAATLAVSMASPRRIRMAKPEEPAAPVQTVPDLDANKDATSPAEELEVVAAKNAVEQTPEETPLFEPAVEPEPEVVEANDAPKVEEVDEIAADPSAAAAVAADTDAPAATVGEEEAEATQNDAVATVPEPQNADTIPAEEKPANDAEAAEPVSESLLSLFYGKFCTIEQAMNDLRKCVMNFFIPSNVPKPAQE